VCVCVFKDRTRYSVVHNKTVEQDRKHHVPVLLSRPPSGADDCSSEGGVPQAVIGFMYKMLNAFQALDHV
jgi:hypothetical protein